MSAEADSSALSLKALAESGKYTALAALVHHADMEDALGALARSARDPEALSWLVALLALRHPPEDNQQHDETKEEAYVQQLDDNLPEDLRIPEDLREGVKELVLTSATRAQQPRPMIFRIFTRGTPKYNVVHGSHTSWTEATGKRSAGAFGSYNPLP